MNPSEDNRWLVRVEEREYGPVPFETLREWRDEGRLIPENDVRRTSSVTWRKAAELSELFPAAAAVPAGSRDVIRRRSWGEIIGETFRIYRQGFFPLFLLSLLTAVPSFLARLAIPVSLPTSDPNSFQWPKLTPTGISALLLMVSLWPIGTAALQLAADTIAHREPVRMRELLRNAFQLWGRMLLLGLLVYGSYTFWTVVPFSAMLGLAAAPSVLSLLLFLLIAAFMLYIIARLFFNFLFWQQVGALSGLGGLAAIRESKRLARSRAQEKTTDRPLFRGATVASVWLLLAIVLMVGAQLPFVFIRFAGIEDPNQVMALAQKLAQNPPNDALTMAGSALAAFFQALIRPLLAASFVVLYYDARAGAPEP